MIKYHKDHKGNWDHTLLIDTFKDPRFNEESDGCVYVVSGEYADVREVNEDIKGYKWVLLIVVSDEQSKFPIEKVRHPKMKVWVQYPKQGRHDQYSKLPNGYTPHTRDELKLTDKDLDFFFSGQVTHKRREDCYRELEKMEGGIATKTPGFTKGLDPPEYMKCMNRAKVVPCPSGPVCADSFRVYEALEAGAVPIADNISLAGDYDYFNYLFDNPLFPTINRYSDLKGYIDDQLKDYPAKNNRVQAWWLRYKRDLKQRLLNDMSELSSKKHTPAITVVIPVSPIKSHPSTEILEKCVNSIRHHLKEAEIIITFDGVRSEQEDKRADYEEFIRRALFLCNTQWRATPVIFDELTHQVGMMRAVIDNIESPVVLYVEGDTGLVTDKVIDFRYCLEKILDGTSNMIRFHYQGHIDDEHQHLMLNKNGKLLETYQYSQRPHLASTAYYRRMLSDYFSPQAKTYFEDLMHGKVAEDYSNDGRLGWSQHRIHLYSPEENYHYSVHFDGREGEDKLDEDLVF